MLAYAKGPDRPLITDSIFEAFSKTAARVPQNTALIVRHQKARFTFAELAVEVERTARGLAGLGLRCGDRVGVWSTNCAEWVLLHLACARVGIVLVNVNPAYRAHELSYILRKSGMRALFLWEQDARADYRAIFEQARAGHELAIYLGTDDWASMLCEWHRCTRGRDRLRRCGEHPVHVGHHRIAQRCTAYASQFAEQC